MEAENVSSPRSETAEQMAGMNIVEPGTEPEPEPTPNYEACLAKDDDPDALHVSFTVLGASQKQFLTMKKDTLLRTFYDYVMYLHGKSGDDKLAFHLSNQAILLDSPKMSQTLEDLKIEPETNMSFDAQTTGGDKATIA